MAEDDFDPERIDDGVHNLLHLQFEPEVLQTDHQRAVAAVSQNGYALEHVGEELKGDRTVVLAAVKQTGFALQHASEEMRGNREIVEAAVSQNRSALRYASSALLLDKAFAVEARQDFYFFKIETLAGGECCVCLSAQDMQPRLQLVENAHRRLWPLGTPAPMELETMVGRAKLLVDQVELTEQQSVQQLPVPLRLGGEVGCTLVLQ
mmetsp:Transcript_66071/g.123239  ORF Transcript_66071/g.123239 Transcript_66071/m.123239 type:complete len:207 (+) Transcript_66071:61-681(+)